MLAKQSDDKTRIGYRPEIDGLRAIAVVLVLLYHVDWIGGGFVGVDVFFVISGFLISRLVVAEVERTGSFDLGAFYERRVRRIFPALAATCAAAFLIGVLVLPPEAFRSFAASAIAAIASVGNIFFWTQAGYFDADAQTKPLLHLWSLGVEEQFYLFWPPLLAYLTLRAAKHALSWVAVLFSISLALSVFGSAGLPDMPVLQEQFADGASLTFYLMPFRIFEFAIGAAVVWFPSTRLDRTVREALLWAGLALILSSAWTFTTATEFPGWRALIPTVGSALVIVAGQTPIASRILSSRVFVWTGLISYSLYLVHWPIIVLYSAAMLRSLTVADTVVVLIVSTAVAAVMYRFVERPYRRVTSTSSRSRFYAGAFLAAVLLVVPAATAIGDGWLWRVPADIASLDEDAALYGGIDCSRPRCEHGVVGPTIFVNGDSFARQLYAGLTNSFPDQHFVFFDHRACTFFSPSWVRWIDRAGQVANCTEARTAFFEEVQDRDAAMIVAYNWDREDYFNADRPNEFIHEAVGPDLAAFAIAELSKLKVQLGLSKVLIIANPPGTGGVQNLKGCLQVPFGLRRADCAGSDEARVERRRFMVDTDPKGLAVLDPFEVFCRNGQCANVDNVGPLYSDSAHLSKRGSIVLVEHFKKVIGQWINATR